MTYLKEDIGRAGGQLLLPTSRFDSDIATAGGSDGGNSGMVGLAPGLSAVKVLNDDWRLGVGMTAALGGGVDYGNDFVGRYQATRSVLQGITFGGTLGYKVNERLSIGGGVGLVYTMLEQDIAINQAGADGEISFEDLDDWSLQGIMGLTYGFNDKWLLGINYRSESDVELEGDFKAKGIANPIVNAITSRLNKVEMGFDLPQALTMGLKYQYTPDTSLMFKLAWEDFSAFSENGIQVSGSAPITVNDTLDRNWKDVWGLGVAAVHHSGNGTYTVGVSYDSSPVDDDDRTFDLPADEQLTLGLGYSWDNPDKDLTYSISSSLKWLGDNKIDQTAQGVRAAGEFSTNYLLFISASLSYKF
jgi:long-chain fatty acid transport protein